MMDGAEQMNLGINIPASEPAPARLRVEPPQLPSDSPDLGWFKAMRGSFGEGLARTNPTAFVLLYFIATRTWRGEGFNEHNLQPGQAVIGDFEQYGLTRQQYRTAMVVLQRYGFATFKSTTYGTIATLSDARIFDVNVRSPNQQNHQRPTIGQPAPNQRPTNGQPLTRSKEVQEGKEGEEEKNLVRAKRGRGAKAPPLAQADFDAWIADLSQNPAYAKYDLVDCLARARAHYVGKGWRISKTGFLTFMDQRPWLTRRGHTNPREPHDNFVSGGVNLDTWGKDSP